VRKTFIDIPSYFVLILPNTKKIPFRTIAAIVAGLLYVLNLLDLIPDFIPLVGQIDDAAVIAACLLMVRQEWEVINP